MTSNPAPLQAVVCPKHGAFTPGTQCRGCAADPPRRGCPRCGDGSGVPEHVRRYQTASPIFRGPTPAPVEIWFKESADEQA